MKQYPEPTVGAIIFNPENKILLCRSHKWNNKWVIPGGHIELGESMEEALRREVLEETGLEIYNIELIGLQESIHSSQFHHPRHFIFIDFLCRSRSSAVSLNDEAWAWAWVSPEEILSWDLGGYTRQFFTEFLNTNSSRKRNILYRYVQDAE